MQSIDLQDYKIHIGDFRKPLFQLLEERQYTKIVLIVDENTREYCLPAVLEIVQKFPYIIIEISSGELHKNIQTCTQIWTEMMQNNADRRSLTVNLGGGVIGDMGGFCACTFKRGMDFLQIPTTLLSQVDASIGGKLGIDFNHVKNSVGVFSNPQTVLIDPSFLKTLSDREVRSGFAEIIKHALIADRGQWFNLLTIKDLTQVDWSEILVPSLKVKQRIVEEDPFEHGIRKALNFGHTAGHAVESVLLERENPLLHGEAIAVGMIAEAYLSAQKSTLTTEDLQSITDFLIRIYEPQLLDRKDYPEFIRLMQKDKKNEGAEINFTLLPEIGDCRINQTATPDEIEASLDYFNEQINKK